MTLLATFALLASSDGSNAATTFVVMTFASLGVLYFLPVNGRRHMAKVGTYSHELSHGLVSLLTGGDFHRFHVGDWGGLCVTSGGNRRAVAAAGYLGTVVIGAVFLARSAQAETLVVTLQVLAVVVALSTLKAGDVHTAAVGAIVAAFLGLFSTLFPNALATRFLLNLMGVILVLQGLKALRTLLILSATTPNTGSDAEALARVTHRTPLQWAVVLFGIAFVALVLILGLALTDGGT